MNFILPKSPAVAAAFPGRNDVTCLSYHEGGGLLYAASAIDNQLLIVDSLEGQAKGPPLRCEREKLQVIAAT